jgi:hypothetical protein
MVLAFWRGDAPLNLSGLACFSRWSKTRKLSQTRVSSKPALQSYNASRRAEEKERQDFCELITARMTSALIYQNFADVHFVTNNLPRQP